MRKTPILSLALAALIAAGAQTRPPAAPFQVHQLTPNVYWIDGGSNSTVIVGEKGVIVIDTKSTAADGRQILDDIAKITPKPVTTVILTHADGDHIGGLAAFPKGIRIITQEGSDRSQRALLGTANPEAPDPDHLPTEIVTRNREELTIDGARLMLFHWAPAHTSGDLVVYLPADRIVVAGDMYLEGRRLPAIHVDKNGSALGWIETVQGMLGIDADRFVAGHGAVVDKQAVQKKLDAAIAERDQIKALIAQGKTLDEVERAVGDPAPGEAPSAHFPPFAEVLYHELTQHP